jgi:hypothetical protein
MRRALVPDLAAGSLGDRHLAPGRQRGEAAQQPWADTAGRVRTTPPPQETAATGFKQRDQATFNPDCHPAGTSGGGRSITTDLETPWPPGLPHNQLSALPPARELESRAVLKACIEARAALAELKQAAELIPTQETINRRSSYFGAL